MLMIQAYTQGNVTVTGGAGAGATTVHIAGTAKGKPNQKATKKKAGKK